MKANAVSSVVGVLLGARTSRNALFINVLRFQTVFHRAGDSFSKIMAGLFFKYQNIKFLLNNSNPSCSIILYTSLLKLLFGFSFSLRIKDC